MRAELHALGVGKRFLRLNTKQNVLRFPVLFIDIVHVVGGYHLNIQFARDLYQLRQHLPVLRQKMILQFDVVILCTE